MIDVMVRSWMSWLFVVTNYFTQIVFFRIKNLVPLLSHHASPLIRAANSLSVIKAQLLSLVRETSVENQSPMIKSSCQFHHLQIGLLTLQRYVKHQLTKRYCTDYRVITIHCTLILISQRWEDSGMICSST